MKQSASQNSLSLKAVQRERIDGRERERLFFLVGTAALVAVVLLWSFSTLLTSAVLEKYDEPFIVTVASCLSFQVYFVFLILPDPLIYVLQLKKRIDEQKERSMSEDMKGDESIEDSNPSYDSLAKPVNPTVVKPSSASIAPSVKLPPLTLLQTARISFVFFVLYFLSNFLLNFALGGGPVSKISNLISTSGFFTLLIGYFWRVEEMSVLRLGAVVLSLIATVFTVVRGFSLTGEVTRASLFALTSAIAYGCYSIYLKVVTKDESRVSMPILFGFVGLYTMLLVVPAALIAHVTGFNTFPTPSPDIIVNIVLNALVGGLLPNYMWNVAFAFTTPLIVAIGLSFSTPLGLLSSLYLGQTIYWEDYVASVIVVLSFAVLNLASLNVDLDKRIDALFVGEKQKTQKTEKKKACCGCKSGNEIVLNDIKRNDDKPIV